MARADITFDSNATWKYFDPVMQTWKRVYTPPTRQDDILVTGVNVKTGEEVAVYFKTDRKGSFLGVPHKEDNG